MLYWLFFVPAIVAICAIAYFVLIPKPNKFVASALIVAFVASLFLPASAEIVNPGEVGVYTLLGTVKEKPIYPGPILKNPLATIKKMSTRTEIVDFVEENGLKALSEDGVEITTSFTVAYHIDAEKAVQIFTEIGGDSDYAQKIIVPASREAGRAAISSFNLAKLYSPDREEVRILMEEKIGNELKKKNIILEKISLRLIDPPPAVKQAMNEKAAADIEQQKMVFVVQKEGQEKQRKTIEAEGIKQAQDIIQSKLTPEYLRWYQLETLRKFAESPTSKTIIVPMEDKTTPLINIAQ